MKLFDIWSKRVPSYDQQYVDLFDKLALKATSLKGEEAVEQHGKVFASNYEFYIYAFFLGIYSNTHKTTVEKPHDFGHPIENWGKKNTPNRKDFRRIQEYMFSLLVLKSDVDFLALEFEEDEGVVSKAVTSLLKVMEGYTNGGLSLIREKVNDDSNALYMPMGPLNELLAYCV
jgi:hypothetical protein